MSDLMLLGVLRMPRSLAEGDPFALHQREQRISQAADRIESDALEIERLTQALAKANASAEHFERAWYLRGDALEKLAELAAVESISQSPDADLVRLRELASAHGVDADAVISKTVLGLLSQSVGTSKA